MSKPNKSSTLAALASALLALASILFMPSISPAQTVASETEAATKQVIADQLDAFQQRDHERAFSHAAPTIQKIFKTTDNFIRMVKGGYNVLYNPDSYIFGRNFDLDGTIHQEVIATEENGKQWQAIYTLKQMPDGSWKITGVKINPYNGAAT